MRALVALFVLSVSAAHAAPMSTSDVDYQIELDKRCIASSDAQIRHQREVGDESGVVDRRALYVAGENKVQCREHIAMLMACRKTHSCEAPAPMAGMVPVPGRPGAYVLAPSPSGMP